MSFVFPPIFPQYGYFPMVSNEDINYAMEEYASAINGCLREHNWLAAGIATRTIMETGCAFAYTKTHTESSNSITPPVGAGVWTHPGPDLANGHTISTAEEWSSIVINGNTGIPVSTGDTTLWILFSAQYFPDELSGDSEEYSHQLGIMVDGRLLTDSCLASFDYTNDDTGFFFKWSRPFTMEAVVRVAPGTHTITPVVKSKYIQNLGQTEVQQINNRELIVLDMRR